MLNCNFLEKGLGIDSPPHFVYDFSREMLHKLYSSNFFCIFIAWTWTLSDNCMPDNPKKLPIEMCSYLAKLFIHKNKSGGPRTDPFFNFKIDFF